jgi:hypothetical protein
VVSLIHPGDHGIAFRPEAADNAPSDHGIAFQSPRHGFPSSRHGIPFSRHGIPCSLLRPLPRMGLLGVKIR